MCKCANAPINHAPQIYLSIKCIYLRNKLNFNCKGNEYPPTCTEREELVENMNGYWVVTHSFCAITHYLFYFSK